MPEISDLPVALNEASQFIQQQATTYYDIHVKNPALRGCVIRCLDLLKGTSLLTLYLALVTFFYPGQAQYLAFTTLSMAIIFSILLPVCFISALRRNSTYLMLLFCFGTTLSIGGLFHLAPVWRASWIVVTFHRDMCLENELTQLNTCQASLVPMPGKGFPSRNTCTTASPEGDAYLCWDCACFAKNWTSGWYEFMYRTTWVGVIVLGAMHMFSLWFSSRLACELLTGNDIVNYIEADEPAGFRGLKSRRPPRMTELQENVADAS